MALTETTDKSSILVLFDDIKTALNNLLLDKTIQSIEIFNSQTDFENQERPRKYPFIMVDIVVNWQHTEVRTSDNSLRVIDQPQQKGQCTVTIHHVFQQLYDETTAFENTEPIRHKVHRAINLISNENYYTKLQRIDTLSNSSHDRVFDLQSIYQCMIYELAYKADIETITDPVINVTYNIDIDHETIRTGDGE